MGIGLEFSFQFCCLIPMCSCIILQQHSIADVGRNIQRLNSLEYCCFSSLSLHLRVGFETSLTRSIVSNSLPSFMITFCHDNRDGGLHFISLLASYLFTLVNYPFSNDVLWTECQLWLWIPWLHFKLLLPSWLNYFPLGTQVELAVLQCDQELCYSPSININRELISDYFSEAVFYQC